MTAPPTDEPAPDDGVPTTGEIKADHGRSVPGASAKAVVRADVGADEDSDTSPNDENVKPHEDENQQLDLPALVAQYESPLIRYASQLLRPGDPEVEDIVQDAFLRMHKQVCEHGDRSVTHPGTWLYRVTRNLVMDTLRKRKVRKVGRQRVVQDAVDAGLVDGLSENSDEVDTLGDMEHKEACDHAIKELHNLPHKQKEAVLLKMIEGMTIRQISEVTGVSVGNVGYRINKGLAEISKRLKKTGVI